MADIDTPPSEIRALYSESCHGAGADARKIARRQLEAIAARTGKRLGLFFEYYGLDLGCYFASKPIS